VSPHTFTEERLAAALKAFEGRERVTRRELSAAAGVGPKAMSRQAQLILALRRAKLIVAAGYVTEPNNGTLRTGYRRA
jgi:hypothetical protein